MAAAPAESAAGDLFGLRVVLGSAVCGGTESTYTVGQPVYRLGGRLPLRATSAAGAVQNVASLGEPRRAGHASSTRLRHD